MSEPESEKHSTVLLAEALQQVPGMPPAMIERARAGYYHDYLSPLTMPEVQLVHDLRQIAVLPTTGPRAKAMFAELIKRVIDGDFDATRAESDAWARTPEAQALFNEFTQGHGKHRPWHPPEGAGN